MFFQCKKYSFTFISSLLSLKLCMFVLYVESTAVEYVLLLNSVLLYFTLTGQQRDDYIQYSKCSK